MGPLTSKHGTITYFGQTDSPRAIVLGRGAVTSLSFRRVCYLSDRLAGDNDSSGRLVMGLTPCRYGICVLNGAS